MGERIWYKDWFNSPYYHVLYKNRDDKEAAAFISQLIENLHINSTHKVWDLACGKGRHSVYLNSKGIQVIGTDLAENSIEEALKSANERLEFFVHDMRTPFRINYFDFVFNLFTSIGYFDRPQDTYKVFQNVAQALKPDGCFVLDFFNCKKVTDCLIPHEIKTIEGIRFEIFKKVEDGKIVKRIEFDDKGETYFFEEKVALLNKENFTDMAVKAGLSLQNAFGDYHLNSFDADTSERLILIFKK